jgi:uncharacterized protein YrrD
MPNSYAGKTTSCPEAMATYPEVLRQSDLLNQLVLNRNTMEELGRVEVLWMYPPAHRVLGFVCKTGFLGNQKLAVQLGQIETLGSNGVLIHGSAEKTTAEKVRRLESLIDHEIWSSEGNRLGKIIDCLFQLRTGEITHYLFATMGWAGMLAEVYQLPPTQILSYGRQRVVVASDLSSFEIYQAGLSRKLTQMGESLKEEAVQEWSTAAKQAEAKTEQAKQQIQQLTEQAKERALRLSEQFKQKAELLSEQFQDSTQTLLEQAKEKSQTLTEQLKEGTHTLSRQVEDTIETLTIPDELLPDEELDAWDDDWFDQLDDFSPANSEPAQPSASPAPTSASPPPTSAANPAASTPDDHTTADIWMDSSEADDDEPWI